MITSHSLAERFATTLTDHDLDAFAALIHDDYLNHNRYVEPGKAGAVAVFAQFLDAFEDFRVEVDDVAVDGDTLVGRYTYRGRHTGTFMGIPASGNEIEMHSIDIWRVSDGQLAEHWDELNTLELFQQMGAIPPAALNVLITSLILAAVAAGATAVIYGTDAFCALVWCPSLAGLDDTALARSAGAVHRYGDARLSPIGATSIAAATASAVTSAFAGHPAGTALAGAAVVALLAWLAVYLRVSAPVNRTLIRAAADAEPRVDARALQRRWNSVIGVRVTLQGAALALLLATLVAHV